MPSHTLTFLFANTGPWKLQLQLVVAGRFSVKCMLWRSFFPKSALKRRIILDCKKPVASEVQVFAVKGHSLLRTGDATFDTLDLLSDVGHIEKGRFGSAQRT